MRKKYQAQVLMVALMMFTGFTLNVHDKEWTSVRIIPIPKKENGYSNFKSTVITSQSELDAFLQRVSKNMGWNNRVDFENSLGQAKLDFVRESLVLLRHTEGSGSVQINFRAPRIKEKRIICQIDRKESGVGTADMAYYCFALAVDKADVVEVEIQISGRKPIILSVQ